EQGANLIAQFEASGLTPEVATNIDQLISRNTPRLGEPSAAGFYAKAAKLGNRVVINADIKDLGLRLNDSHMRTIEEMNNGDVSVRDASLRASDEILGEKRRLVADVRARYSELLAEARKLAAGRPDAADLLAQLANESEPLMLVGGDEI